MFYYFCCCCFFPSLLVALCLSSQVHFSFSNFSHTYFRPVFVFVVVVVSFLTYKIFIYTNA